MYTEYDAHQEDKSHKTQEFLYWIAPFCCTTSRITCKTWRSYFLSGAFVFGLSYPGLQYFRQLFHNVGVPIGYIFQFVWIVLDIIQNWR